MKKASIGTEEMLLEEHCCISPIDNCLAICTIMTYTVNAHPLYAEATVGTAVMFSSPLSQLSPSGMETCPPNISDALPGSESPSQIITAASKNHSRLGITPTSTKKEKHPQVTKDSPLSVWATMSKYKKYVSLLVLIFQNTALVLTMRYSRTGEGPKYLASTAVVLTELLKFTICFGMVFHEHDLHLAKTLGILKTEIVGNFAETIKLSIPAILYTIQNNLLYLALSHLDAATFQV